MPWGASVKTVPPPSGAQSAANGRRLRHQLLEEEGGSIFDTDGTLKPEIVAESKRITDGPKIGNKELKKQLTSDGSSMNDWGKYETMPRQSRAGVFRVHFYLNSKTGATYYGHDFKAIFEGPKGVSTWIK